MNFGHGVCDLEFDEHVHGVCERLDRITEDVAELGELIRILIEDDRSPEADATIARARARLDAASRSHRSDILRSWTSRSSALARRPKWTSPRTVYVREDEVMLGITLTYRPAENIVSVEAAPAVCQSACLRGGLDRMHTPAVFRAELLDGDDAEVRPDTPKHCGPMNRGLNRKGVQSRIEAGAGQHPTGRWVEVRHDSLLGGR